MQKVINKEINILNILKEIATVIVTMGGKIYFVGGYVRDKYTGKENKDIDVEVYGLTPKQLKEVLSRFGVVDEIGASFGVFMIHGLPIDFALPRREVQGKIIKEDLIIEIPKKYNNYLIGELMIKYPEYKIVINNLQVYGHKDFIVIPDPFMSLEEATKRRDFTMNALMEEVLTGNVVDCWNGIEDIKKGIIRHIDDSTFIEDSLRVLRACQFASRFDFSIDKKTKELCKVIDLSTLPKERIYEEFKKALLKSDKPSIALEYMRELKVLETLFPELNDLIDCKQSPVYHPEGTVWNHVKLVVDEASLLKQKADNPERFMFGALCHDIGKANTTKIEGNKISSYGHEVVGAKIAKTFMNRLTNEKKLIEGVMSLTLNHMRPLFLYLNGTDKAFRKFALEPNKKEILLLAEADYRGKGLTRQDYSPIREKLLLKLKELGADKEIKPLVTGKDLIEKGLVPGKAFKVLLEKAMDLQLEGLDKEEILNLIIQV